MEGTGNRAAPDVHTRITECFLIIWFLWCRRWVVLSVDSSVESPPQCIGAAPHITGLYSKTTYRPPKSPNC